MRFNLQFYIARLKTASFAEMRYRMRQALLRFNCARILRRGALPCSLPPAAPLTLKSLAMPALRGVIEQHEVERILVGERFDLKAGIDTIRICESQWHTKSTFSIDHSGSREDIRAIWEPARLQHLTILFAYLQQHPAILESDRIKNFARCELLSWLEYNRFLHGPHYLSAMECGLRIPVFFYSLKILDNLSREEFQQLVDAVYLHAWWIEKNLSLYSSLGNHTVCEAVGLVFAGGMLRQTDEGRQWLKTGIALLGQELPHQVLSDGGPAEQSFSYHRFVLDLYWLAVDFLESNNLRECADFKHLLRLGEQFLATVATVGGSLPQVGDCDDGYAIAPGLAPARGPMPEQAVGVRTFPKAGYTVFKRDGLHLIFDHGPLGMKPLYNHGHADALSVLLAVNGRIFLVDPGTFRYNGVPSLRAYFKGTRAHNTVTVDGINQATQVTGFIWEDPYEAVLERCYETDGAIRAEASHDGYMRLSRPLCHFRSVTVTADGDCTIHDSFKGKGIHTFELAFHLHPEVKLSQNGHEWQMERDGIILKIDLAGGSFREFRGEETPLLGWFSPAYGGRELNSVLLAVRQGEAEDVEFHARIRRIK